MPRLASAWGSRPAVLKWWKRFDRRALDGLFDAPRTISDNDVERVIATTLDTLPEHATQ